MFQQKQQKNLVLIEFLDLIKTKYSDFCKRKIPNKIFEKISNLALDDEEDVRALSIEVFKTLIYIKKNNKIPQ